MSADVVLKLEVYNKNALESGFSMLQNLSRFSTKRGWT